MSLDDQELLNDIILESKEHLARIEPDLLTLEKNIEGISGELVNSLFRTMHSIKGGFAFMGMANISSLAHALENALARLRDGQIQISSELVDVLLEGVDRISHLIDNAKISETISTADIKEKIIPFTDDDFGGGSSHVSIEQALSTEQVSSSAPAIETTAPAPVKQSAIPAPQAATITGEIAKDKAPQSAQQKGAEAVRVKVSLLDRLMNLAAELVFARNQMMSSLGVKALDALDRAKINAQLDGAMEEARRNILAAAERGALSGADGIRNSIEAAVSRELEALKAKFTSAVSLPLVETPSVKQAARQVNFVTSELQESVMGTRLQPVGMVFGKLPRIIRDLSKSLGKQINIEIKGDEVELDKSIIEALSDPLTHIIRNCADHGIELPDTREKAGKTPAGTVRVSAYHEGGQVHIEITDDGKGIDPAVLKRKAIEKGIITSEKASRMSDPEAQALIFAPGFSTAASVTDVSGRGVGMDVVRTNIESLGGVVELHSTPGTGTRLLLKLPLTMAIIPALIVQSHGRRYAIPQANIDELVRIRGTDVASVVEKLGDSAVIRRQGRLLPLLYLSELFGLRRTFTDLKKHHKEDRRASLADRRKKPIVLDEGAKAADYAPWEDDDEKTRLAKDRRKSLLNAIQIAVLKVDNHRFGLIVEEMLDTEEIVVKPLSSYIKGCACYSGATIMGDGKVTMILDPAGVASVAGLKFDPVDKEYELAQKTKLKDQMAERQNLFLFKAGGDEVFAINIDLIARIENINGGRIRPVGEKEFVNYADHSMRILRLEQFLPIKGPSVKPENFFLIIPKLIRNPMGIVATEIVDVVKSDVKVDREKVTGPGIFGTGVIDNWLVVFVDIYNLFETAEPSLYKDASARGRLAGKKILLAEDTIFFRQVTTKYLEEQGCEVRAVNDGQIAWETLASGERFDVLLTDINMPRMNGLELTRKVRASGKFNDLPIVTLTSMGLERDKKIGYEAGVTYYELKLDKERLLATLRKIFGEEEPR